MLPFLGSVLHMLTYSLPAILGPVGAAEESPSDANEEDEKESRFSVAEAEPRSGAQATATYYAAVQVGGGVWEVGSMKWRVPVIFKILNTKTSQL